MDSSCLKFSSFLCFRMGGLCVVSEWMGELGVACPNGAGSVRDQE